MAKSRKKKRLVSPVKIECMRCKERKDPRFFINPWRAVRYWALLNVSLTPPDEYKPSQPFLLCSACREILRVKVNKKRHYRQPKNRLSGNIRTGIGKSFRTGKPGLWEWRVGYSLARLRGHLQKRFEPGMSWSNYGCNDGQWQIDHIEPVSSFGFSSYDDKDFKRCWSLSNLRPLWAMHNWSRKKLSVKI